MGGVHTLAIKHPASAEMDGRGENVDRRAMIFGTSRICATQCKEVVFCNQIEQIRTASNKLVIVYRGTSGGPVDEGKKLSIKSGGTNFGLIFRNAIITIVHMSSRRTEPGHITKAIKVLTRARK